MNYFNVRMGLGQGLSPEDTGLSGNTECVYSKIQKIHFKTRNKDERQRDLRVTVELLTGVSPTCQQNLLLQLTDDDDPFLLYTLLITEDDFKSVKTQQSLLVDFDNFPSQFVRLLEHCKDSYDTQGPRFLLMLEEEDGNSMISVDTRLAHLKIVETNNFKNLCHLDLKIGGGSDSEVKQLMGFKIRQLKEEVNRNEKQCTRTNTQLNDSLQQLDLKCREVEELKKKWREEKNELLKQHSKELARERDKLSAAQHNWQQQTEREKRESKVKHVHMISTLESQLAQLTSQNHILFEKNCQEESANREKCSQLEVLKKQISKLLREVGSLRKQNSKLDLDYHEKEKLANNLRTKCAVIEQEVKDKSVLLSKQQELLQNANEQKVHVEESLREKECTLQRKQMSLKNLSDELVKANEILTKLQTELASVKGKLKMRTDIALEQEQLLDTKQKEIFALGTKVIQLEQKIKDQETSEMRLRESLTEADSKLEAKDKQLRNNDNVIHWLNRQLSGTQSELQSSQLPGYSSTPVFHPLPSKRRNGFEALMTSRTNVTAITPQIPMPKMIPTTDTKSLHQVPPAANLKVTKIDQTLKDGICSQAPRTFSMQSNKKTIPSAILSAYFPKTTIPSTSVNSIM